MPDSQRRVSLFDHLAMPGLPWQIAYFASCEKTGQLEILGARPRPPFMAEPSGCPIAGRPVPTICADGT